MFTCSDLRRAASGVLAAWAAASGCGPPAPAAYAREPRMEVTYHHDGRSRPVSAAEIPPGEVEAVLDALRAESSDVLRLFVSDHLIGEYRARGTGLEVVYPAADTFATRLRGPVRADRFFVLFSGPGEAAGDVLLFHADGPYEMPPLVHRQRSSLAAALRARLAALAGP